MRHVSASPRVVRMKHGLQLKLQAILTALCGDGSI